ncbi:MAG TPA: heavy-metal-associated domain-containing protein [Trueperaceae bacterium]|nr:heavy-metal-associated domain-containing protein [Trueperaceae bacterium]
MSGSPTSRAVVGVRGMETPEARQRVRAALAAVSGVKDVLESDGSKMIVDYDPTEATVMDLIRALRRIGFLAGME